ncbi:Hsp70 family protein [Solwaraspora sp. WMMD406]|uniref:Hsp70 family protein n=1 Tax=Solwaraspora sp. WMMD406 TaxID=3016095 RepID=UPI0024178D4F|nr:hsp70 family protein [Solwaraspora sp. WMMD406]MDG4766149.1 Hsp70 family protein [Solwaraspora sp. WMMD406]MDG4768693.1 Hsp70 family protein [Solwaraspora sp. WMMD406]
MRALGIDFGTSNTVAMVRGADRRTRPLLFDGAPLLPSGVYREPDGRLIVGRDAERRARIAPSGFEPNPKRRVDDGVVLLGDVELPVPQVIAAVLRHVAAEARRQLGGVDEVRLTHPAQWAERRRLVLIQAAHAAGLPKPMLVAEPVAAASYYTAVLGSAVPPGRSLAIYDLGGGTFDATVVRRSATGFDVLAEQGLAELGGLDFDQALVEHLGQTYSDTRTTLWNGLVAPADTGQRRARALLYDDVRGAKEMLSRTTSADVHLPALDIAAHVTREELESLIRGHLARTVTCLAQTIAGAGLAPGDLVGIFLVGGSSRIPLAANLIHTELGVAPTTLEQPETVVAEGALCLGFPARPGVAGAAGPGLSGTPRAVPAPARPVAGPRPPVLAPRPAATPHRPPVGPNPAGRPAMTSAPPAAPTAVPRLPVPASPAGPVAGPVAPVNPVGPPAAARPPAGFGPATQQPMPPPGAGQLSPRPGQTPNPGPPVPSTTPYRAAPTPTPQQRPPAGTPRRAWYEETGLVWMLALGFMVFIALIVLMIALMQS